MPPLYAALDVVVLPSWREGFPRSLLEASVMARPIVATAIRGCREAVEHGRSGLLVPPRAPAALRQALESLLGDPGRARELGRAARERAARRFDERAVFERLLRAYRELPLAPASIPLPRVTWRTAGPLE
jgi:glycosyltransferase involved in cell wall biosynthesis